MVSTLSVAAIQLICKPLCVDENLSRAKTLVSKAAEQGTKLVLLPELSPSGYLTTEEIWNAAETSNGKSTQWLKTTAKEFSIYIGLSFIEADGGDFYNSFLLCKPDGEIAGRVRKSPPAAYEAFFFKAGTDPHVINTEIGRIGVGICYENLLFARINDLHHASVDLLLQPMAAGSPEAKFPISKKDVVNFNQMVKNIPPFISRALGVPVVMANQCGPLVTGAPKGFPAQNSSFPGYSAIIDSDGRCINQLGSEEGLVLGEIRLDPSRRAKQPPRAYGQWSCPVPWFSFFFKISQKVGERHYRKSHNRVARARELDKRFAK